MQVDFTIVKDSHNREAFTTQKVSEPRYKQLTHEQVSFTKIPITDSVRLWFGITVSEAWNSHKHLDI